VDTGVWQCLNPFSRLAAEIPVYYPVVFHKQLEIGGWMIAGQPPALRIGRISQHSPGRCGLGAGHWAVAFLQYGGFGDRYDSPTLTEPV
jgi:hypothetical protein